MGDLYPYVNTLRPPLVPTLTSPAPRAPTRLSSRPFTPSGWGWGGAAAQPAYLTHTYAPRPAPPPPSLSSCPAGSACPAQACHTPCLCPRLPRYSEIIVCPV